MKYVITWNVPTASYVTTMHEFSGKRRTASGRRQDAWPVSPPGPAAAPASSSPRVPMSKPSTAGWPSGRTR